jgi:hypothetical protein
MHFHVLGPQARFPYAGARKYTPPDAPLAAALALHERLSVANGLVVHANTHGFDNGVDLDAVARSDGRYLAVVRLDGGATREGCQALRAAERAVRFAFNPQHGGTLDQEGFRASCAASRAWAGSSSCIRRRGLPGLRTWLESIPATVVMTISAASIRPRACSRSRSPSSAN